MDKLRQSLRRIRNRQHRCFELAGMAVTLSGSDAVLIHGTIEISGFLVAHAWVITADGRVYDPVEDAYYSVEAYAAEKRATVERSYTPAEAQEQVLCTQRWGPWHETAGATRKIAMLSRARRSRR